RSEEVGDRAGDQDPASRLEAVRHIQGSILLPTRNYVRAYNEKTNRGVNRDRLYTPVFSTCDLLDRENISTCTNYKKASWSSSDVITESYLNPGEGMLLSNQEQPRVFVCDDCLIGKISHQLDFALRERINPPARQSDDADRLALSQERHAKHGATASDFGVVFFLVKWIGPASSI